MARSSTADGPGTSCSWGTPRGWTPQAGRAPARPRAGRHRRPRLHRPGRRPGQPRGHYRLQGRRTKPLTAAKKQVNKWIASVRAVCERAFAHLKNWRILTKLRLNVRHATTLLRALLVLTNTEVAR
ncbi:transposase family protein [Streptomyces sp. 900105755]